MRSMTPLFVFALCAACGSSNGMPDPATPDAMPMGCVTDPGGSPEGEATPITGFAFMNAFDPSDTNSYDPDDAASLPGPLMVDTWGNRGEGAHGTLGVFPPGFSAPLHTHTNEYYGVVLRGQMTNPFGTDLEAFLDDDDSNNHGETVLDAGSYWHVPGGSQHTTTCVGPEVCWFYFHSEEAFDFAPIIDETGALPTGVTLEAPHADSVLLPRAELAFAGEPGSFVQFAPAWGSMGSAAHGTFGLFEAGATSPVHVHSAQYYGVVAAGEVTNAFNGATGSPALGTGGYWSVPADSVHVTACAAGEPCLFYFHSRAGFDFTPVCE